MVAHNVWDDLPDEPPGEYVDLKTIVDFGGFDYTNYRRDEEEILRPQLEAMHYTEIQFLTGDGDCWGPLTRIVRALDHNKEPKWFIYG